MSEHTPGPWDAFGAPGDQWIPKQGSLEAAPGLSIGSAHHTEPICRVNGYLLPLESNARLITAAPEMLAALEAYLKDFACVEAGCHMKSYDLARAAIAKAKGHV